MVNARAVRSAAEESQRRTKEVEPISKPSALPRPHALTISIPVSLPVASSAPLSPLTLLSPITPDPQPPTSALEFQYAPPPRVTFTEDPPRVYYWHPEEVVRWCFFPAVKMDSEDAASCYMISFRNLPFTSDSDEAVSKVQMDSTLRIEDVRIGDNAIVGTVRLKAGITASIEKLFVGFAVDETPCASQHEAMLASPSQTTKGRWYSFALPLDDNVIRTTIGHYGTTGPCGPEEGITSHCLTFRISVLIDEEMILLDDGEDDKITQSRGFHIPFLMATLRLPVEASKAEVRDAVARLRVEREVDHEEESSDNEKNPTIPSEEALGNTSCEPTSDTSAMTIHSDGRTKLPPLLAATVPPPPLASTLGKTYYPGHTPVSKDTLNRRTSGVPLKPSPTPLLTRRNSHHASRELEPISVGQPMGRRTVEYNRTVPLG
ncbi:hypothetical protein HDU85_005584 [Gaertneriomyces sp. JEL0708]|nr:hypothetical protein HDU85_005584 [Gaertneriomyces sp. JEL0708]